MTPQWYTIARGYLGLKEVPGSTSNPTILGWAAKIGGWVKSFFTNDDIPWCKLFVDICLLEAGISGPKQSLAAKDYATWGRVLLEAELTLGAILVFVRPGGHHVGFYAGERADGTLRVLGGNQSNAVSETWIAKERLLAIRWPKDVPLPTTGRVILTGDGLPVSTNEG
jgi:uncharacterized protein (TIGR02594 family)